ncbi:MAG: hypothetical protein HND42_07385 [Armatimonadetes bacterium]|nr:hypothetical protein [Armatimonadota bacterium]
MLHLAFHLVFVVGASASDYYYEGQAWIDKSGNAANLFLRAVARLNEQ